MFLKAQIIFSSILALCINYGRAYGANTMTQQSLDFGTIIQLSDNAAITVDINGNVTSTSGVVHSGTTTAGMGTISADSNYRSERIEQLNVSSGAAITLENNCTLSVINPVMNVSDNQFAIAPSGTICSSRAPESYEIEIGASLQINDGYCPEGTYTINVPITWNEAHCDSIFDCYCRNGTFEGKSGYIRASVTIKSSLSVKETQSLDFGTIVSMPEPQNINMSTNGQRSGGIMTQYDTTGQQGIFTITGAPEHQVNINVPASAVIQNSNGTSLNVTLNTDSTTLMLNESGGTGMATFSVGGTLVVNANQEQGEYQGTYTVSVNY